MKPVVIEKQIKAPADTVFETVAHIDNFRNAVEDIVDVEFVSETKRGKGTIFRETRLMGKRKATVEMEVTEYQPPGSLRIVSKPDPMGTVWDSLFTISGQGDQTQLRLEMTASSKSLLTKLMNSMFTKMIRTAVDKDMEALKEYCERQSAPS